jgi:hypothetical protein
VHDGFDLRLQRSVLVAVAIIGVVLACLAAEVNDRASRDLVDREVEQAGSVLDE